MPVTPEPQQRRVNTSSPKTFADRAALSRERRASASSTARALTFANTFAPAPPTPDPLRDFVRDLNTSVSSATTSVRSAPTPTPKSFREIRVDFEASLSKLAGAVWGARMDFYRPDLWERTDELGPPTYRPHRLATRPPRLQGSALGEEQKQQHIEELKRIRELKVTHEWRAVRAAELDAGRQRIEML